MTPMAYHIFSCFLDASKAFDRVNHWKLFRKLIIRKVSLMIVRMLIFWYSKKEMCIIGANPTRTSSQSLMV